MKQNALLPFLYFARVCTVTVWGICLGVLTSFPLAANEGDTLNDAALEEPSFANVKSIVVTNSKAWRPFSYLSATGEPSGILIDLWKQFEARTGIEVKFLLLNWGDSLQAMRDGRADVHAGLVWSQPRSEFLDFNPAILKINTQLYMNQRIASTDLNFFLTGDGNRGVGVVAEGYEEHFVKEHFPMLPLVSYASNEEMMAAAFRDDLDAFVADLFVASFHIHTASAPVTYIPALHLFSADLRPAVARGNDELKAIIQAGMDLVIEQDRELILQRWSHIETVYPKHLAPILLGSVVAISLFYILLLKRTVKQRTLELEQANQNLTRLAEVDFLTDVHNRRYFMTRIKEMDPDGRSVAVMICDIDDFKRVNDTFGHGVGDQVIKQTANALQNELPPDALFARVGGEEFAVVIFDEPYEQIEWLANTLCSSIAVSHYQSMKKRVTISLGCVYYPHHFGEIRLKGADKMLYKAKDNGKNQACILKELP